MAPSDGDNDRATGGRLQTSQTPNSETNEDELGHDELKRQTKDNGRPKRAGVVWACVHGGERNGWSLTKPVNDRQLVGGVNNDGEQAEKQ